MTNEETKPEQQMDPKLAAFIQKHQARFSMWAKANGNVNFPVALDKDGEYRWLNRDERRRLQKIRK